MLPHRKRKSLYWKEENVEILSIYVYWAYWVPAERLAARGGSPAQV